jgi:hypothetical protein
MDKLLIRISTIGLLSMVTLAGCGSSVPPPNDEWAAAQSDVGRAQQGGSPDVPDAKLHLQLAQENLQKAKALIDDDNARATSLTALARVEATLALSLAKASKADAEASKAKQDLQKLKAGN